jgi:hypothetical protein
MIELDVVKKPSTPRFAAYRIEFAPQPLHKLYRILWLPTEGKQR